MRDCRLAGTTNRSVVGIMNEFTYLAEAYRDHHPGHDLLDLAMRLATTPCGPLHTKNITPDRELAAFLRCSTPYTSSNGSTTDTAHTRASRTPAR